MIIPDNLNIEFDEMCKDCPYVELNVEKVEFYGNNYKIANKFKINCKHEDACRRAWRKGTDALTQ